MAKRTAKQQKIVDGAVKILQNPDSFCKNEYFKYRGPTARRYENIDPTYGDGFERLQLLLKEAGATLDEPNYKVCGEGAIYVSAALQGYTYEDAATICETIGDELSIPEVNDAKGRTRDDVREYIASWGRKLTMRGKEQVKPFRGEW